VQRLYFDHNATTPLRDDVRAEWLRMLDAGLGNPSSVHGSGRRARAVVDEARERTAAALGVHENEVVFTSGGTESIHLALRGGSVALAADLAAATTSIEHAAVHGALREVERGGRRVLTLAVDANGRLDVEGAAQRCADARVGLVSIGLANNEIGVVQDVAGCAAALARRGVRAVLHTDAVQALGRLPLDLPHLGAHLVSFSAHKVGGPLGVGVLVVRGGAKIAPLQSGGGQELGLRSGTENAAALAAAALAIELAVREQSAYAERVGALTRRAWHGLVAAFAAAELAPPRLLGPPIDAPDRLPNTLDVLTEQGGDLLLARLDLEGLEASAGSACASGSLEPSPVLLALGLDEGEARRGLRLSLGRSTTAADVDQLVEIVWKTCRWLGENRGTSRGSTRAHGLP
jgi:cysteine desulfurase